MNVRIKNSPDHKAPRRLASMPKALQVVIIGFWVTVGVISGLWVSKVWVVGDPVSETPESSIHTTIQSVTYDPIGSPPFEAPPGKTFVIIQIRVTNNTDQVFNFAPVIQTSITDERGTKYEMSPAVLSDPINAGSIAAGSSATGSLSYLVPKEHGQLQLHFQPGHTMPEFTAPLKDD